MRKVGLAFLATLLVLSRGARTKSQHGGSETRSQLSPALQLGNILCSGILHRSSDSITTNYTQATASLAKEFDALGTKARQVHTTTLRDVHTARDRQIAYSRARVARMEVKETRAVELAPYQMKMRLLESVTACNITRTIRDAAAEETKTAKTEFDAVSHRLTDCRVAVDLAELIKSDAYEAAIREAEVRITVATALQDARNNISLKIFQLAQLQLGDETTSADAADVTVRVSSTA